MRKKKKAKQKKINLDEPPVSCRRLNGLRHVPFRFVVLAPQVSMEVSCKLVFLTQMNNIHTRTKNQIPLLGVFHFLWLPVFIFAFFYFFTNPFQRALSLSCSLFEELFLFFFSNLADNQRPCGTKTSHDSSILRIICIFSEKCRAAIRSISGHVHFILDPDRHAFYFYFFIFYHAQHPPQVFQILIIYFF